MTKRPLFLIAFVALLFRVVHFSAIASTAFVELPLHATETDMFGYWQWSGRIAAGDWLQRDTYHPYFQWMAQLADQQTWAKWWGGTETFQQEPGYPYTLAVLRSAGMTPPSIVLLQLLCGVAQPVVTFLLAARLFDRRVAICAALIAATYGPLIFSQGTLLRDWIGPLAATAVLYLMVRANQEPSVWWLSAGLVLGIALWFQSTLQLFVPLALVWTAWTCRQNRQRMLRATAMYLVGVTIGFSPLMLRNAIVGAPLTRVTNRAPEGLITSLAADANPIGMNVNRSLGPMLAASQGSGWQALRSVVKSYDGNYTALAAKLLLKLKGIVGPIEIPNNLSYEYGKIISPCMRILPGHATVWPLAMAGIAMALLRGRTTHDLLLLLYFTAALAALLSMPVLGRYRLLVFPVLNIYAATALVWSIDAFRSATWRPLVLSLAVLVVAVAGQYTWLQLPNPPRRADLIAHPVACHISVQIYLADGRYDQAVAEAQRLYRVATDDSEGRKIAAAAAGIESEARTRWGIAHWQLGNRAAAFEQLRQAESVFPHASSLEDPDATFGILYAELGVPAEAVPRLRRYLERNPNGKDAARAREKLAGISG